MFLHVLLWLTTISATATDDDDDVQIGSGLVPPHLHARIERVLELSDMPTARMILRLLALHPSRKDVQVTKRLKKLLNSFQQQLHSMMTQFLATPINDETPSVLVDLVLFLVRDDKQLFQAYMTRRERARLLKAIERYERMHWPESRPALHDVVLLLGAARSLRDLITRLRSVDLLARGAGELAALPHSEYDKTAFYERCDMTAFIE